MASPSLNAENKPSWPIRTLRSLAKFSPFSARIEPEVIEQDQKIEFTRYGLAKVVKTKSGKASFGDITGGNQFMIERPGGGVPLNAEKALANNKGFVYAAVNAKAREVMVIDWRLFQVTGEEHEEQKEHAVLDLLDAVNDNMTSLEFKYLLSSCLDLTGSAYVFLEGVKNDLDKPKAIHLVPPDKISVIVDRRAWPFQLVGYKMKLDNGKEINFNPYEIIHFRLPNPGNFFEGMSPVAAAAEYIDNDNDAWEFNRKFFRNGARPAGFLKTPFVSETQLETLQVGFASIHQGVENANRIGVLPKDVEWQGVGSNPKDMDFSNLSKEAKERILMMFGTSRTILGTAESDTNRATAETADYVFSKRVIKPHMMLICAVFNERLIPRYGDDLYISFIDPVPEDRAARTTEMQASVGSQPILTVNEARDQFIGLGPVDGGDVLMKPGTMAPVNEPTKDPETKPKPAKDEEDNEDDEDEKKSVTKLKLAYRPTRTKLQKRAEQRNRMKTDLNTIIRKALSDLANNPTKKFGSTKANDEVAWVKFKAHVESTEKQIEANIREVNAAQKKEVLEHLPSAIEKAVDPKKLFDVDKWISITVDAVTPALTKLYQDEAAVAAAELGKPGLTPLSDIAAQEALHKSISMMAESYNETTLATLEEKINAGLSQGQSLAQITETVKDVYEWSDTYRAERVSKTEAFRTSNMALKETWKQTGVVKTIRWYTATNPCDFCKEMDGKIISIDANFLNEGDTLTAGDKSMTANYGDVGTPPLHPNCMCFARPEDVSI
jgi:HK97 family phage portal protein